MKLTTLTPALASAPATKNIPRTSVAYDAVTFSAASKKKRRNTPKMHTSVLWGIVATFFGGIAKDIGLMLSGSPPPGVMPATAATPKTESPKAPSVAAPNQAPAKSSQKPLAKACADIPTGKGKSTHTHHAAHAGPTVVSGHGDAQPTLFVVGQQSSLSAKELAKQGVVLGAGQQAVQVSQTLLKNIAKTQGHKPLNLPKNADTTDAVAEACYDLPDGSHTHHGVWPAPNLEATVLSKKTGKTLDKSQPMAWVVGQTVDELPDHVTPDTALNQQAIQVVATVFNPDADHHHH